MTATEVLCRLLDERGEPYIRHGDDMVTWRYYTDPHSAIETLDGTLQVAGLTPEQAIAATLGTSQAADEWGEGFRAGCDAANEASEESVEHYKAENAELREQMERLVTLLRVDCDIDASWDGLRRFWSIGLTEGGCLMRDRACKAEAESAKLRELCKKNELVIVDYRAEVAKLREFASEAFSMAFNFYHGAGTAEDLRELTVEYRELGIEVGDA